MVPASGIEGVIFRSALVGSERVINSDLELFRQRRSALTIVSAMASIGSGRLCAHAEKLCQYGHFTQLRRKVSTTCAKSRPAVSRTSGALFQHCQVCFSLVRKLCQDTLQIVPRSTPKRISPITDDPLGTMRSKNRAVPFSFPAISLFFFETSPT